jgi:hypothetical protein
MDFDTRLAFDGFPGLRFIFLFLRSFIFASTPVERKLHTILRTHRRVLLREGIQDATEDGWTRVHNFMVMVVFLLVLYTGRTVAGS